MKLIEACKASLSAEQEAGDANLNNVGEKIQNQSDATQVQQRQGPNDFSIGTLCIKESVCILCGYRVRAREWGNPKCLGCSIVDIMAFENHPFNRLLCSRSAGQSFTLEVAMEPFKTERADLTPPPLRSSETLRN